MDSKIKMKMKKTILAISALTAGTAGALSAQSQVVAAWDYSQFSTDGFTSIDGATLEGSVNSNYTDFQVADANGVVQKGPNHDGAHQFGTMYWDGSFGSDAFDNTFSTPNDINPSGSQDLTAGNGVGNGYTIGSGGSGLILDNQGQQFVNPKALGFTSGANGKSFVFGISLTGEAPFGTGSDWVFQFGARANNDPDNASAISWDYSLDGSAYTASGITSNVTDSEGAFTVDLSGVNALDGASQVFLRGNLSGIDGGSTFIDNFSASAVPEPSAFAAIAGMLALGLTVSRRRFRK